jgi:hypothetical protein
MAEPIKSLRDIREEIAKRFGGVAPKGQQEQPSVETDVPDNETRSRDLVKDMLAGAASSSGTASPEQQMRTGVPMGPQGQPVSRFTGSLQPLTPTGGLKPLGSEQGGGSELQDYMNNRNLPNQSIHEPGEGSLSAPAIAHVASQAGFEGDDLVKAVAVALAESRGNPRGMGDVDLSTPGEKSVGLWQINYRPGRDDGSPIRDPQGNLDPLTNARNARQILDQQGWRAWSVTHGDASSNSNHYSRFLDAARQAVAQLQGQRQPAQAPPNVR